MPGVEFQLNLNYGDGHCDSVIAHRVVNVSGFPKVGTLFKIEPVVDYGLYGDVVLNGFKLGNLYRNVYCRVVGCTVINGTVYNNSRLSISFLKDEYEVGVDFDDVCESADFFKDDGYVDKDGVFQCFLSDLNFIDVAGVGSGWEFVHVFCWLLLCFPYCDDVIREVDECVLSDADRAFWDVFMKWYKSNVV